MFSPLLILAMVEGESDNATLNSSRVIPLSISIFQRGLKEKDNINTSLSYILVKNL
jgi:hypothetical protein